MTCLRDLEEVWSLDVIPKPERQPETLLQNQWATEGVVHFDWPAPNRQIVRDYTDEWLQHNGGSDWTLGVPATYRSPMGWDYATPYMDHPALMRLACDPGLGRMLEELTGEPMGVHLCLTGWQSTTRDWHRDQYLNWPFVGGYYLAVWLALDDISVNAGPFQYVARSHHGAPLSQDKVRLALGVDGHGPDWPTHSERLLTPLFEELIEADEMEVVSFMPKAFHGLVWHSRLLHRGSRPIDPTMERRGVILHYSGIFHRHDMPPAIRHPAGGWYFPLGGRQPVRSM